MNQPTYLKPWLARWKWGTRIALFLLLLSAVVEFAAFALSQNYVLSYLGAQPEDVTFSIQICYAGILSALPLQERLLRWFEMKYYLLTNIMLEVLLLVVCIFTRDIILFFIIRFFQGVVVCSVAFSVLTLIPGFLKLVNRPVVTSSIFYGTVLSSSALIGVVASQVSLNADFTTIYKYLVLFQIIMLVLVLVGFSNKSNIRRYPLFQVDWPSALFFVFAVGGLAYMMIYGSKYYWFTDRRIVNAALICLTGTIFFVYSGLSVKRPLIDFSVFLFPKFWVGLILLALYFGMKESINIIFGYTASVLQWSSPRIVELALCNVGGLIIFMFISANILIRRQGAILGFLIAGFSVSLIYHLWMYYIFTPDLSFGDLLIPMFLQGAASGILFVPIMIFILTSVPPATGITGLAIAAYTRFVSLLCAGAGFYNLQQYYGQLYWESFLYHLTGVDSITSGQLDNFKQFFFSKGYSPDQAAVLANASLAKAVAVQTQLLANKATFLFIAVLTAVILLMVLLFSLYKTFYTRARPVLPAILNPRMSNHKT